MPIALTLCRCRPYAGSGLNGAISPVRRARASSAMDGAPLSNVLTSSLQQVLMLHAGIRLPAPSPGTGFPARVPSAHSLPLQTLPRTCYLLAVAEERCSTRPVSWTFPPRGHMSRPALQVPQGCGRPQARRGARKAGEPGGATAGGSRGEKLLPPSFLAFASHRSGWAWHSRCGPCTRYEWMGIRYSWGMG